jgi:HlyD family secretion protein
MKIFRTNALDNLHFSEATHVPFNVITPGAWWWLSILAILILVLSVWAIAGRVSLTVAAQGILLPKGSQVIAVSALSSGNITAVYIKAGAKIKKGEVLAEIDNPESEETIRYLHKTLQENKRLLIQFNNQYREKQYSLVVELQQQEKQLQESLKDHQEKLNAIKLIYIKKQQLLSKHYLTIAEIEKAKEEYISAKEEVNKVIIDLYAVASKSKDIQQEWDEKLSQYQQRVLENEHALANKILEKSRDSKIVSIANGKVMSCNVSPGDYVHAGKILFNQIVENSDNKLESLVFINHLLGKKVRVGMEVYVLPSMISSYSYGFIKGHIISISEYPSSKESVQAYLGNTDLVDEFFQGGVPFAAKVKLETDASTASGLAWTIKQGAPFAVEAGTVVATTIVIRRCAPFQLFKQSAL